MCKKRVQNQENSKAIKKNAEKPSAASPVFYISECIFKNLDVQSMLIQEACMCKVCISKKCGCAKHASPGSVVVQSMHLKEAWICKACISRKRVCANHACLGSMNVQSMHLKEAWICKACISGKRVCANHASLRSMNVSAHDIPKRRCGRRLLVQEEVQATTSSDRFCGWPGVKVGTARISGRAGRLLVVDRTAAQAGLWRIL